MTTTQPNTMRTFWIIIATQMISILGSSMTSFAIGIKVFKDTGQVTPLALVSFFGIVPRLAATSFAGVLADRWDRRKVIMISDTGQALTTLVLLLAFATDNFSLALLYVMVVIGTIFGAFQDPASSAIITMLVPDEKRDLANTVQQVRGPAASILSPIIASLLFVVVGVVGVMAIDMLSFLVAVAVIGSVHIPHPEQTDVGREAKGSVLREAWSGFQFLFARRVLFYTILYAMSLNFLFNMAGVMLTPFVLTLFDSEATLGLVMSALSAGPLVGGIAFGAWKRNVGRIHVIFIAIILMGLFMGLMGLARNPYLLVFLAFITLLPNPAANASLMSLMQIKTPPDMQGRVFAAIMQLAMLATPLAYLLAGPLADQVLEPAVGTSGWEVVEPLVGSDAGAGMGLLMFVNGMIIVVTGLLLYATPKMRSLEASLPDYAPVIQNQNTDEVAYGAEHPSTPHPSPSM